MADNYTTLQRMAIEVFEDSRIEHIAIRQYPGLQTLFLSLHPIPIADACDLETQSCLRHGLAMLSRALLDSEHVYNDPDLLKFTEIFHQTMKNSGSLQNKLMNKILPFRHHNPSQQVKLKVCRPAIIQSGIIIQRAIDQIGLAFMKPYIPPLMLKILINYYKPYLNA